jgi:hypothetical protein
LWLPGKKPPLPQHRLPSGGRGATCLQAT